MARSMVTVRVRKCMHNALKELAHERRKTLNELCADLLEEAVRGSEVASRVLSRPAGCAVGCDGNPPCTEVAVAGSGS